MQVSEKPTLADLRNQHYFDISTLAERAGVDLSVIHHILNRQPVQRYQAELVLAALADELSTNFTLDTIDITLSPEEDEK